MKLKIKKLGIIVSIASCLMILIDIVRLSFLFATSHSPADIKDLVSACSLYLGILISGFLLAFIGLAAFSFSFSMETAGFEVAPCQGQE